MPTETTTVEMARAVIRYLNFTVKPRLYNTDILQGPIEKVLIRTFARFQTAYPELGALVFDEIGIKPLALEFAKIIGGQDAPNPNLIAKAWAELVPSSMTKPSYLESAATTLIQLLRDELSTEPFLSSLPAQIFDQTQTIIAFEWMTEKDRQLFEKFDVEQLVGKLLKLGDYKSAIYELDRVLREDPLNRVAHHLLEQVNAAMYAKSKDQVFTKITFGPSDLMPDELTPEFLAQKISPCLIAIAELQAVIDEVLERKSNRVVIRAITQNSPISVGLDGASEAIQTINDIIIPWRRKHAQTMAQLMEQEKLIEIESKKAEVLEKRAHAEKERSEVGKQREETEKLRLENDKLRIELHRAKIALALDILNSIAPHFSETDRIAYLVKLLPPLEVLALSELEISSSK